MFNRWIIYIRWISYFYHTIFDHSRVAIPHLRFSRKRMTTSPCWRLSSGLWTTKIPLAPSARVASWRPRTAKCGWAEQWDGEGWKGIIVINPSTICINHQLFEGVWNSKTNGKVRYVNPSDMVVFNEQTSEIMSMGCTPKLGQPSRLTHCNGVKLNMGLGLVPLRNDVWGTTACIWLEIAKTSPCSLHSLGQLVSFKIPGRWVNKKTQQWRIIRD